jgi:hypothetical protein
MVIEYKVNQDNSLSAIVDGKEVKYVLETDLLAVKGSRETAEKQLKAEAEAAKVTADSERQKVLAAEAKLSTLTDEFNKSKVTSADLAKATAELATAKTSSEKVSSRLLAERKKLITKVYGVPAATVESKTLEQLDTYEEALIAVTGKNTGNFAFGGGGGAASNLVNTDPMTLATEAYRTKIK